MLVLIVATLALGISMVAILVSVFRKEKKHSTVSDGALCTRICHCREKLAEYENGHGGDSH